MDENPMLERSGRDTARLCAGPAGEGQDRIYHEVTKYTKAIKELYPGFFVSFVILVVNKKSVSLPASNLCDTGAE
jgi:hypothetical protein